MADWQCPIVQVVAVEHHPEADRLDIVTVLGYDVIVQRDEYKVGDLAAFIPPDTLVDTVRPEFAFLAKQARKDSLCRIRSIRLRGMLSQGLLMPSPGGAIGDNTAETWGAIHYEPPPDVVAMDGDTRGPLPVQWGSRYNILRYQSVVDKLPDLSEIEFVATEKLEGTNGMAWIDNDGSLRVCSHNRELKDGLAEGRKDNVWWRVARKYQHQFRVARKYQHQFHEEFATRFEVIGSKIGGNIYALNDIEMRIFDIQTINGRYFPWDEVVNLCHAVRLPVVPFWPIGKLIHTPRKLVELARVKSILNPDTPAEGIVIRPVHEEIVLPEIGRVIFKIINSDYDAKRAG